MVDELKQETNSAVVTLEGYISNTNLSNFDFDNTSTVVFDSFSTFRSGIYSTSIEIVTKSIKNPQYIRLAGGMLADSPLTAIGIAMSINDEGLVQATVTGLLTSGLTTAVGVLVIAPAITTAGLPTATAIGVGIVATGIIGLITDKLIDGVYDFAEKQISEYKYNENNKSLELNTNLENINDIKTLVEPTILYGSVEENEYVKNITINQKLENSTTTYSVKSCDTMFGIANRFGVSEEELIEANPWLADRYSDDKSFVLLLPNEHLLIPTGVDPMSYLIDFKEDKALTFSDLFTSAKAAAPKRHDPLLVDLDGDGIETTKVANGVYFDHKNDGFAEKSAWVGKDDGILVVDRNNNGIIDNGTELLGDQFVLSDGTKATSGFAALSSFDSNEDLIIDENDELFNQIKVLKGDGTLLTLEQAGIASISLTTTTSNTKDSHGNTKLKIGSYTTTDGQTREATDYIFQSDLVNSISTNIIEVPEDIEILPDAIGFGVVDTLHQAMAKDSSGSLKTLVQSFINENNISQKQNILTNIIYKWAGVENINNKMFLAA